MKNHYIIPFFIPHKGCPFTCIFCRQDKISGKKTSVKPDVIPITIRSYLKTIPKRNTYREVGFFGGSFTGIDKTTQEAYLAKVLPFLEAGEIQGLRLSTRPDYITPGILRMLKKYGVNRIELGVQSMSDQVLMRSKRGHTAAHTRKASRLILDNNILLGHQLMVGLPESSLYSEVAAAKQSIALGASEVRIYPVVVLKGTALARLWRARLYKPLSEDEAIKRCARLLLLFEENRVNVIRCGLHPSESLLSRKDILAGPFHPAFRQKVESYIYGMVFKAFLSEDTRRRPVKAILYNPAETAYVIGYKRINASMVERALRQASIFKSSARVRCGTVIIRFKNDPPATLYKLKNNALDP